MLLSQLFSSPASFFMIALAIVYGITIHEFSHAAAANYLGDSTAKYSGRLNLNPLSHMELFGTIMLLLAGFGWGKPVPVNPYNLRWKKYGSLAVSLAGPLSNIISVAIFIIIFNLAAPSLSIDNMLLQFLVTLILVNMVMGIFNLIPVPPLDGSKILLTFIPDRYEEFKRRFLVNGPWILILLLIADNFLNLRVFDGLFTFFLRIVDHFLV